MPPARATASNSARSVESMLPIALHDGSNRNKSLDTMLPLPYTGSRAPTQGGEAMIETAITRSWKLKHPIVQAPMAGVAGADLAAAVSSAGGLGMLGVGSATTTDWIAEQAERVGPRGPFGIGLMVWAL